MKWHYDIPATKYWEGLPVGTGRFAAMIPGSTDTEVIAFNDETLYTGGPYNPNPANGPETLKKVRELIFARDYVNADKESEKLAGQPKHSQLYQPMGRLNINYGHPLSDAKNYRRELNMDNALVNVSYQYDGVAYQRRIFASYPDQVIVVRLTADKKAKINFSTHFTSLQPSAKTRVEGDEIIMEGTTISEYDGTYDNAPMTILPPQMKWQSRLKILNEGGSIKPEGDQLTLKWSLKLQHFVIK
jgi:alpha-L-fucosidase 2